MGKVRKIKDKLRSVCKPHQRTTAFYKAHIPRLPKRKATRLGGFNVRDEGFDFVKALPPSCRRQADAHWASAFKWVRIPLLPKKKSHPTGWLFFFGRG